MAHPTLTLRTLLFLFTICHYVKACVYPTGIDDGPGSLNSALIKPLENIFTTAFIPSAGQWLLSHETPIQFYYNLFIGGSMYSSFAAYEPEALDPWARRDVMNKRRRCPAPTAEKETALDLHRNVSAAYTTLYLVRLFSPPQLDPIISAYINEHGLNATKCLNDISECDDLSTPWGLAYAGVNDWLTWTKTDGWDRYGTLKQEFNSRPFSDWRDQPYAPVNTPWNITFPTRWTPLLEDNGHGYLYHQTHVVPHIGSTGKTMYISDPGLCNRTVPNPSYDLEVELTLALERTSQLDDKEKMVIEFLDTKTNSLTRLSRQWRALHNIPELSFKHWASDYALNSAIYHATLVVWREKIRHDLMRPITVAQILGKGRTALTYAGQGAGIREIPVDQWKPYIRTMPHTEFPSFSSCVCEVFREIFVLENGTDDVGGTLSQAFPAGSSIVEPGITPAQDLILSWSKFSDIAKSCSESRINGGMHFTASVPAGIRLCSGIGTVIYEAVGNLAKGKTPASLTPFDSPVPLQERCPVHGS